MPENRGFNQDGSVANGGELVLDYSTTCDGQAIADLWEARMTVAGGYSTYDFPGCEGMQENPRLFAKRPWSCDDYCTTVVKDPKKGILGQINDPYNDSYAIVCMLCHMEVRNVDHIIGGPHTKKLNEYKSASAMNKRNVIGKFVAYMDSWKKVVVPRAITQFIPGGPHAHVDLRDAGLKGTSGNEFNLDYLVPQALDALICYDANPHNRQEDWIVFCKLCQGKNKAMMGPDKSRAATSGLTRTTRGTRPAWATSGS